MIRSKRKRGNTLDDKEISKAILEVGNDKTQSPTEFICNYCSRSFTRKYNIVNHIQNFHMNTSCYCEICEQKFGSPAGLQLHLNKGHNRYKQPNPECDVCGKIFTRKANIIPHLATMHDIGVVPSLACNVCSKTFTTERNLKRHVLKLHNPYFENPICDECNMVFRVKQALISHIESTHNISVKDINRCYLCERVYCLEKNLKRHVEIYHGEKYEIENKYKCHYCPKEYTTNHSLKRHFRAVHVENQNETQDIVDKKKSCQCDCGKTFDEEPLLRQHIKNEHPFDVFYTYCKNFLLRTNNVDKNVNEKDLEQKNDKVNKCESFSETFDSMDDLRNHIQLKHCTKLSLDTCNVCFTKFVSKDALDRHRKGCIPPDNVNRCKHCEKLFTEVESLKFHIKIFHPTVPRTSDLSLEELDEVPNDLKCEYCDKLFKVKQNVKKHIEYVHLGMLRYKCLDCESIFTERRNLRKHIRLKHVNSKNFPKCNFCKKRFESAKAFQEHLENAHSYVTKTFPCELCSQSFESNDALEIHMKIEHTEQDELFKCENCSLIVQGFELFEKHKEKCHDLIQKTTPKCVICIKNFSCLKTLIRHIKQFHEDFDAKELAEFGFSKRSFVVDCKNCLQRFTEDDLYDIYLENKDASHAIIFKCDDCGSSYNVLEYGVQRYKINMNTKRKKASNDDKIEKFCAENEMEIQCIDDNSENSSDIEIVEGNL
ncbi:uncharacterized protein [Epargyreus clarus]|uniref:uncharacterized protein n=1 Tax=Epargyreus clarus TaxID=520877 RepID=UPI003C2F5344